MKIPQLITAGVIARELGQSIHRVTRILNTRSHIKPVARAGVFRLYDRKSIQLVREAIEEQDAKRYRKPGEGRP